MQRSESPEPIRVHCCVATVCSIFIFFVGCWNSSPQSTTTGGDSPVTTSRLSGTRLTDIRDPISWSFNGTNVVIENKGMPIPPDVVQALLKDGSVPLRIEATWRLNESAGALLISDIKADGEIVDKEVAIPISPAGHIRVNLGSRQYNMYRDRVRNPLP